jgi:hypothetical protein
LPFSESAIESFIEVFGRLTEKFLMDYDLFTLGANGEGDELVS